MAESIGVKKLRQWREVDPANRTPGEIAQALGTTAQTVRNWGNRGTVPSMYLRPLLAILLGEDALTNYSAWSVATIDGPGAPIAASERDRVRRAADRFARMAQARAS